MYQLARVILLLAAGLAAPAAASADEPKDRKPKTEFRLAEDKPRDGLEEATVEGTMEKVHLHKTAALTSADVATAKASVDPKTRDPIIEIKLTEAGAKKLEKLTGDNIGRRLAIVVNGKVVSAPVIQSKIGESANVTGKFTQEEAEKLAAAIGGK